MYALYRLPNVVPGHDADGGGTAEGRGLLAAHEELPGQCRTEGAGMVWRAAQGSVSMLSTRRLHLLVSVFNMSVYVCMSACLSDYVSFLF